MAQTRGSVLIQATPDQVFDFVANTANDHRWRTHLTASHGRATAVGDRISQTYTYQGKTQTGELEVTEFSRPERLGYVLQQPVRARFSFQFRPEGSGTRASMSINATVPGKYALFEGRVTAEAEKLIRTDLERLKHALE